VVHVAACPSTGDADHPTPRGDDDLATTSPERAVGERSEHDVERAALLWQEYSYRHDLIWRLLFRSTSVAVLLAIAPFTIGDLTQQRIGSWIKILPMLALVLVAGSTLLLRLEFKLFMPVVLRYDQLQRSVLGVRRPRERDPNRPDFFKLAVFWWQAALFLAACVAAILALRLELDQ
jgi:hypothetical protein